MPTLRELEQRDLKRAENAAKEEKAAALRRKKRDLIAKKRALAIRLTRVGHLGEAWMKAHETGKLTPQHMAMMNEVLLMLPEADRGENWDVMEPFLISAKRKPVAVPDREEEAA